MTLTPSQIAELEQIATPAAGTQQTFARTDLGNAERFAQDHSDVLQYVRERRSWLAWDGTRWQRDATGDAERAAKATTRTMLTDAASLEDDDDRRTAVKWALASQSETRLRAMLTVAATEPLLARVATDFDRDPFSLTCANGILDLRTREIRAHDPSDLCSLRTDILHDPEATCPRWTRFLNEIFGRDQDLIEFVRRLAGYCLTGDTREHSLVVLHGTGANGKTTFTTILQQLAGEFAKVAAFDSFTRRRDHRPRNDLARLHRARLVTAAESGEGRRLDEATIKEITGGDTIAVRFLYGEHFEYRPEFKLMLVTNHRPRIDDDGDGIWRRLRLIPFEQSFIGREDRNLTRDLQRELPGILNWALDGCAAWQADGLGTAAAVTRATTEYRTAEDNLGAFLDERCERTAKSAPTSYAPPTKPSAERWANAHSPAASSAAGSRPEEYDANARQTENEPGFTAP